MKWSERSIFYKAVLLTESLCVLVYGIAVVCYFCGVISSVWELPWVDVAFGTFLLCQGIDNLKISRISAVMNLVTAAIVYLTTILAWVL